MADDDKVKGMAEEAKGRAKQAWGGATGDDSTQAEGKVDELKGKARQKVADVKEALDDDSKR